jgi:hypothetical protein
MQPSIDQSIDVSTDLAKVPFDSMTSPATSCQMLLARMTWPAMSGGPFGVATNLTNS